MDPGDSLRKESNGNNYQSALPITAPMTPHFMPADARNFIHILSYLSSNLSVWLLQVALQIHRQVHRGAIVVVIAIIYCWVPPVHTSNLWQLREQKGVFVCPHLL